MDCTRLGKSDLKVSRIGLGGLQFGTQGYGISEEDVMRETINRAIDNGINFIDTAEVYAFGGSERVIGETIKDRGDRDDLVIATKVYPENLRYNEVLKAADASLKRLQTDVIDLYQIHHPNPVVPMTETSKAMDELLEAGKVRYVGVSNFDASLTQLAVDSIKNGEVISNQIECSLIVRDIERETLPFLRDAGIVTIAYSPLAMGLLTGKYDESTELPKEDRRANLALFKKGNLKQLESLTGMMREIADAHDASVAQVALNWLLRSDDVFPIPGAKSPEQAESNASAAKWERSGRD
ncbi:MAG: aldo/keto reductase [Thermoplasmata archaeon]|nr:aldo/keto reductase [Thermoplasmata archaeon]